MEVTRASLGRSRALAAWPILRGRLYAASCSYSTQGERSPMVSYMALAPPPMLNRGLRFVPERCDNFFKPNGKLLTSRENNFFLHEHAIEPDHGRMHHLTMNKHELHLVEEDLRILKGDYNLSVRYSPQHTLSPWELRLFDPRGHPCAGPFREELARRCREEPLWLFITTSGGPKSCIRVTASQCLRSSLFSALEDAGYNRYGKHMAGNLAKYDISGTIWITVNNAIKLITEPREHLGPALVRVLKELQRNRQLTPTRMQKLGEADPGKTQELKHAKPGKTVSQIDWAKTRKPRKTRPADDGIEGFSKMFAGRKTLL